LALNSPEYATVKQSLIEVGFGSDTQGSGQAADTPADPTISLLATYAAGPVDMGPWTRGDMRFQYLAGMAVNNQSATQIIKGITAYQRFPEGAFTDSAGNVEILKAALEATRK
jgi:hypothetical protein